jgi:hypothetical protein
MRRWLLAVLLLGQFVAQPATGHAQGACDDLAQQVGATQQQLDQAKQDVQPWLMQAIQYSNIAPSELAAAAAQGGIPGLTPDLAATYGALIAQVGAQISTWASSNGNTDSASYLRDLISQVQQWEGTLGTLAPVQGSVASLVGLSAVFGQLDQLLAGDQATLAILDSLSAQLQACQAGQSGAPGPTPPPGDPAGQAGPTPEPAPAEGGDAGDGGALCSVGGKTGASRSDCFTLENDAAYQVWAACTEQYFAAVQDAFRTGGDVPANTCDAAWDAEQQAIQQRWGAPQP